MAQKDKSIINNISEYHQENRVRFVLEIPTLNEISDEQIWKIFKLQSTIATTNLVLFTRHGKIARFASEVEILKEFFEYRVEMYEMRKEYMLAKLKLDYEILANKVQFIQAVIAGTIKINGKKRSLIMQQCKTSGLKTWTQLQDIMTKFIKNEGTKSRIEKRSP